MNQWIGNLEKGDFKLFEDRPHLTAALDGWSDVADYALTWTAGRSG